MGLQQLRHLQVLSWGNEAMRWLYVTAQHSPDHRTLIVEAFAAWVRLGLLYEQDPPQTEIQGLLSLTYQGLLHSSDGESPLCWYNERSVSVPHALCRHSSLHAYKEMASQCAAIGKPISHRLQ